MSGGFSFPPPPPPPPKTTSGQQDQQHHDGFRGRGRGRGSYRGASNPRGRGQYNGRTNHSSGYAQQLQANAFNQASWQPIPPGVSVNPTFTTAQTTGTTKTHQLGGGRGTEDDSRSPNRSAAGHKRKLDALRSPQNAQQERKKLPGPQTAPAIPSFGAPILPEPPKFKAGPVNKPYEHKETKKPASKSLGLIPATLDLAHTYSDSEEEGVDEEAMHAELGDKLTFEHNGVVMSLKSQADLAAWKKERQRNWPTQTRMAEKEVERRRIGEERKRLLGNAGPSQHLSQASNLKSKRARGRHSTNSHIDRSDGHSLRRVEVEGAAAPEAGSTNLDRMQYEVTEHEQRLNELRRKVAESEARNRAARAEKENSELDVASVEDAAASRASQQDVVALDRGVDGEDEQVLEDEDEHVSEVSDASPAESSSDDSSSDSTSDSDSDNDAPEEVTSKPPDAIASNMKRLPCKYFAASGYCRDGDACRFRHDQPVRTKPTSSHAHIKQLSERQKTQKSKYPMVHEQVERKSIFQRLVEQEQNEEDRLALQVIKYLGKAGLFKKSAMEET